MKKILLLLLLFPLEVVSFPQSRAGVFSPNVSCVVVFDAGIEQTISASPIDVTRVEETQKYSLSSVTSGGYAIPDLNGAQFSGICRYDLTNVTPGTHTIKWGYIPGGPYQIPVTFIKPSKPTSTRITPN